VVAAEMKQMASATGRAADQIAEKLAGITSAAHAFLGTIDSATGHVGEITVSSHAIAAAVRQQQDATDIIARSADQVLADALDTDTRSRALADVASENRAIAEHASRLAASLNDRARELSDGMNMLLADLRAA
jgi:methyl-accepting chemotaxis protein